MENLSYTEWKGANICQCLFCMQWWHTASTLGITSKISCILNRKSGETPHKKPNKLGRKYLKRMTQHWTILLLPMFGLLDYQDYIWNMQACLEQWFHFLSMLISSGVVLVQKYTAITNSPYCTSLCWWEIGSWKWMNCFLYINFSAPGEVCNTFAELALRAPTSDMTRCICRCGYTVVQCQRLGICDGPSCVGASPPFHMGTETGRVSEPLCSLRKLHDEQSSESPSNPNYWNDVS
jgi:hypothetical protein